MTRTPRPSRRNKRISPALFLRRCAIVAVLLSILAGATALGWHGAKFLGGHAAKAVSLAPAYFSGPRCDVLVLGGTPSGIAAAIAAARRGSRVILVEENPKLGGDIVYSMLNMFDVPLHTSKTDKTPVATGIFGELYNSLGVAFDIGRAEKTLEAMVKEQSNIRFLRQTKVKRLIVRDKRLEGAVLHFPDGREETVSAPAIVDATNDAQFAALAGAGYYLGREISNPDRKMQSAGLLFSVENVRWSAISNYVQNSRALSMKDLKKFKHGAAGSIDVRLESRGALLRLGGISGNYAWERGDIIKDYVPHGKNIVVLSVNFGRQDDGSVILNTLNIVGVNGLSHFSRQAAKAEATREIPFLLAYLKRKMPGFRRAKLGRIAPDLYIRETRHIHGYCALQVEDVKENRAFYDRIALCSYPLDLHPYQKGDPNPFGPRRYLYTLPLRALVPRKVDGVFVASRSLSATYSAAGSARVIPITMAAGQAAGMAAARCAQENVSPHQLVWLPNQISALQKELRATGLDIGDRLVKPMVKPKIAGAKE